LIRNKYFNFKDCKIKFRFKLIIDHSIKLSILIKIDGNLRFFCRKFELWRCNIVPPENRTVSLVEKKQLNLQYVTAKKIQFRIQI
jgi:hypothetical protein